MGLFDAVFSFFTLIDGFFGVVLPQGIRLIVWGVIASVFSMALYALLSSQTKLAKIKKKIIQARKIMIDYDDKFSGIWQPVKSLLGLSFRQIGYTLLPSMAGAVPVVLLIVWIGSEFKNRYLPFGPEWMGYPEVVFILSVLITSLIIKYTFKIQ